MSMHNSATMVPQILHFERLILALIEKLCTKYHFEGKKIDKLWSSIFLIIKICNYIFYFLLKSFFSNEYLELYSSPIRIFLFKKEGFFFSPGKDFFSHYFHICCFFFHNRTHSVLFR